MKKFAKHLLLAVSIFSTATNIFVANAGIGSSTQKGVTHSSSSPTLSAADRRIQASNAYYLYPANEVILRKYVKKGFGFSAGKDLPPEVLSKVNNLIEKGVKIIDDAGITGRTGTRNFTFMRDAYSDSDTAAINEFANKLLLTSQVSKATASATDVRCRYSEFIIGAYTTIHSTKLLTCSQQLKALQMVFAGLAKEGKYNILGKNHTDRLLELDPEQVTRFALTIIRTPIDPILQPGDCAILIEFPDVSLLYVIR